MNALKGHPIAEVFPMFNDDELGRLAEDIRENGLKLPIVTYEGCILDGRNRYRACRVAGVEPKLIEWDGQGGSPTLYVVSMNLHRRHLTANQRAAIAAELVPLLKDEAKKRQEQHGGTAPGRPAKSLGLSGAQVIRGRAHHIAADAVQVGHASVTRALQVQRADPEAFARIKRGEATVTAELEKIPKCSRNAHGIRKSTGRDKYQPRLGNAAKRRMISALSGIRGTCMALSKLDISLVRAACSAEEIQEWSTLTLELMRTLRKFRADLTGEGNGS